MFCSSFHQEVESIAPIFECGLAWCLALSNRKQIVAMQISGLGLKRGPLQLPLMS